jgi:flagellar biosynthesis component FlhA
MARRVIAWPDNTREVCSTQPVSNSGLTEVNAARLCPAWLVWARQDETSQGFQPTKGIQMETKQPDFQLSADSAAIVKAIEEMPVGGVITYAQLSAVIGRDIRHFRGSLESARKSVQRDKGMVFDVIRKEGIKRTLQLRPSPLELRVRHCLYPKRDKLGITT